MQCEDEETSQLGGERDGQYVGNVAACSKLYKKQGVMGAQKRKGRAPV